MSKRNTANCVSLNPKNRVMSDTTAPTASFRTPSCLRFAKRKKGIAIYFFSTGRERGSKSMCFKKSIPQYTLWGGVQPVSLSLQTL